MSSFLQFAYSAETLIDKLRPKRGRGNLIVEPYIGYTSRNGVVVRGRILEEKSLGAVNRVLEHAGAVGAMLTNFLTNEVSGVEVCVGDTKQHSDEEGYFSFEVSPDFITNGNVEVGVANSKDTFSVPISQTKGTATHGVISDIDDTLLETGAWNVARNLWTTFTTASTDRVVFDDTISLIRSRVGGHGPLFYVSSSPWNLHQYLLEIFMRTKAPIGPIFLRDLGIDETKFIKSSHGSHKGDAIDLILAANPNLTFTLIGDTGQHDGEVYLDAATRHPGRITEICLRAAGQIDEKDTRIATSIRNTGAKFFSGPTFEPLT